MFLFSRLKTYLAASAVIFGALVVAYFKGKQNAESEHQQESDQYLIQVIRQKRGIEDEVEALDDVGLGERASRWLRNADNS